MADTTPARRPGRNARRRAAVDRVVEEAYEAGVRDGRAELRALEADLAAATHFLIGPYRIGARHDHWEVWPDPTLISLTSLDPPTPFHTRDGALAHARRLTAEETDRG
ncbi:hypothetical protein NE857_31475 [Nocardiopsis exhalans]|uniref:Uncharacterized protein n=1 Tax=Nocardiopsis exhalans TaxID=163604 RepID=A0ABY5D9P5_9ACTN|nr:hypothetical protein [Nocardiopsis exhalans]USY19700.1 hypothetical protein NE857_31475 [Nocardiopsis exhalans]